MSLFAWLHSLLSSDATLQGLVGDRIYRDIAVSLPGVVFSLMSSSDVYGLPRSRILTSVVLGIKAVGRPNQYNTLVGIADRVDAIMSGVLNQTYGSLSIHGCVRTNMFSYQDDEPGGPFCHVGAQYRILVSGL